MMARWKWHFALLAVLTVQVVAGAVGHRSTEKLRDTLETGAEGERVRALFILMNRDEPIEIGPAQTERYLAGPGPLREWTMTGSYTRLAKAQPQIEWLRAAQGSPESERALFIFEHRPGTFRWITLERLRDYLSLPG